MAPRRPYRKQFQPKDTPIETPHQDKSEECSVLLWERNQNLGVASKSPNEPENSHVQGRIFTANDTNNNVRAYYNAEVGSLGHSELPSPDELKGEQDAEASFSTVNFIDVPWPTKEEYLRSHFHLLKEDALKGLRKALAEVQNNPYLKEHRNSSIGIYDNVHINGLVFSRRGIAFRISFSLDRIGKRVNWDQSKRLLPGSLIALMSIKNPDDVRVAIVAARPVGNLWKAKPEIDLFFARTRDVEIDSEFEWVMIEDRAGYFEGQRHTLVALQKMLNERFPLSEYLVNLKPDVDFASRIRVSGELDLSLVFQSTDPSTYRAVDVLHSWPSVAETPLDDSQQASLRSMLTQSLSLCQGPPGTGKTLVSVFAIATILNNMHVDDPPMILTCHTNHALDQLLRHVAGFTEDFARLGGRSKDDLIKSRTLFHIRQHERIHASRSRRWVEKKIDNLTKKAIDLLQPFCDDAPALDPAFLKNLDLLTEAQVRSLIHSDWVTAGEEAFESSPLRSWAGDEISQKSPTDEQEKLFEWEEADQDLEDLREVEAEAIAALDDDSEALDGKIINLFDSWDISRSNYPRSRRTIDLSRLPEDLYKVMPQHRGHVYHKLLLQAKEKVCHKFRGLYAEYTEACKERQIAKWEEDAKILGTLKIIGLTTTGFSKYRDLINSIKPRIVLVEEAAETLEAPLIATCVESLEQLILVGDHKQLRPRCNNRDLESYPHNLNISMFERLVKNGVQSTRLARQRRMIPQIRGLLTPIYGDGTIQDHPSVSDPIFRPPVPGMGEIAMYFLSHTWSERKDGYLSTFNEAEANFIAGFIKYLLLHKVSAQDITVLTLYNGQRRKLEQLLRSNADLAQRTTNLKIRTVDSYQGEENAFILLSLVRSNPGRKIGFLEDANRVCVALSRAQRGLFMFGDSDLLTGENKLWKDVIQQLSDMSLVGPGLPIVCNKHGRKTVIEDPADWNKRCGGCDQKCGDTRPCGHPCLYMCHPMPHTELECSHCMAQNDSQTTVGQQNANPDGRRPRRRGDISKEDSKDRVAWQSPFPPLTTAQKGKWAAYADGGYENADAELLALAQERCIALLEQRREWDIEEPYHNIQNDHGSLEESSTSRMEHNSLLWEGSSETRGKKTKKENEGMVDAEEKKEEHEENIDEEEERKRLDETWPSLLG